MPLYRSLAYKHAFGNFGITIFFANIFQQEKFNELMLKNGENLLNGFNAVTKLNIMDSNEKAASIINKFVLFDCEFLFKKLI